MAHILLTYTDTELKEQLIIHRSVPKKTYMDVLLSTSFMKKNSTPDTKLGHHNEPIIMNSAILESKKIISPTIYGITYAASVGLVSSLDKGYLHASPDFLLLISKEDKTEVAFAEIKCRTRVHTANLDRELDDGSNTWVEVDAISDQFKKYVRNIKERFQLIHQASTLQITKGVLVIGDKDGNVIRGVWINFDQELIDNYCRCLDGIYKENFSFTFEALEGRNDVTHYLDGDTRTAIQDAIKKQEYVDFDSFIYNFKFWVSFRRCTLPLMTSKRCIPSIAALWNRSKNGSDVTTGLMRGSWYPLPTASRTPSALVVQRILFLLTINIMRIATFLTFKGENGEYENIDKFRNRTNKMYGSYRAFLMHFRRRCIVPMMRRELSRKHYALHCIEEDNPQRNIQSTPSHSSTNVEVTSRRQTRSTAKVKHIPEVNETLKVTDTTPTTRNKNGYNTERRVLKCKNPLLVRKTGEGKKCIRCKAKTKTFCLGCHQHMCMYIADDANVETNIAQRFQDSTTAFKFNLGKRKSRPQLDTFTSTGKRQRKTVSRDVSMEVQGTCYNIIHQHLLEKQPTRQAHKDQPDTTFV